ncbi:hypothetical protein, partial [Sporolactobacillus terrae]|uniref:hypothetical protein n=1 Tax=Sporolactobacillus terrae TaxID=269673 RepID=UPI0005652F1F
ARGKRAAGVSFVHKVMNKARMEGGSKDRAYFARFFLQIKKVYDFVCGTTIRVISSISPLQARKPPYPAEVTTAVARFI